MSHFGNGSLLESVILGAGGLLGGLGGRGGETYQSRRLRDEAEQAEDRRRRANWRRMQSDVRSEGLSDDEAARLAPQGERVNCRVIGDRG